MKKKILFFSGTRADYGLLSPLIRLFSQDVQYETEILATGSHLSKDYGYSLDEIKQDGFNVRWPVDIELNDNSEIGVCHSLSVGMQKFSEVLNQAKPDLAVILGDRYEGLNFAVCCRVMNVSIVHIHGGELTEGAIDDAFRHCITKLSQLHFTAAEDYRKRVIQLGESPERVHNVGALGVDNIKNLKLLSRAEIENEFHFKFKKHNFLLTLHPETTAAERNASNANELIKSLKALQIKLNQEVLFIFTMPNADPGSLKLYETLHKFISENSSNCVAFKNMGYLGYLSSMAQVDAVIGNSSSGLLEAPAMNCASVNIGDRQKGRLRTDSVFDTSGSAEEMDAAFEKAMKFHSSGKPAQNLFGDGNAAKRIKKIIDASDLEALKRKPFYDQN